MTDEAKPYVVVTAGGLACALPLAGVVEAMRDGGVRATASQERGVVGVATVRGRELPVVDLRLLLGMDGGPEARQRLVRLRLREGREAALSVGDVLGVRTLAAAQMKPMALIGTGVGSSLLQLDLEALLAGGGFVSGDV